jgi:hypothetical protein
MNSMMGRRPTIAAPIDDALGPELLEHALADFVRALVVPDFLAHQKDAIVAIHLLDHRFPQGLSEPERSRHLPRD